MPDPEPAGLPDATIHPAARVKTDDVIRHRPLLCLLVLLLGLPPIAAASGLPEMGDPVDRILSPREEAAIGREMMSQARRQLDLNRDPEIAAYIDGIGQRLARQDESPPIDGYTFFVMHAASINAFAAPGGYIGVHSGLVLAADSESQLASVLAHEIAHVSQRHIARAFARNQQGSYTTLAAILAGLIIGAQNPQAGQAALTGGIAAEQQRQLNYTRSNEYEADRIGIRLLANAGYAPSGMVGFFEILRQASGPGASDIPEFLRTHPLSEHRIAEAASRARDLEAPDQREDTLAFHLMKARMAAEYSDQPGMLYERWRQADEPEDSVSAAARKYGLGLLDLRLERPGRALERLQALHDDAPDNLHYALALARARQAAGDGERALSLWRQTRSMHSASWPVVATGQKLLLANGSGREAVDLMLDFLRGDGAIPPDAWHRLAEAADTIGDASLSHEALGEYYVRLSRLDQALTQLNIALDRAAADSPEKTRLKTRIEQVKDLRREWLSRNPIGG